MSKDTTDELVELVRQINFVLTGRYVSVNTTAIQRAILDWHNKQIDEVLDRLLEHGEDFTTFGDAGRSVAVEYIEAERNKLKEPKV